MMNFPKMDDLNITKVENEENNEDSLVGEFMFKSGCKLRFIFHLYIIYYR